MLAAALVACGDDSPPGEDAGGGEAAGTYPVRIVTSSFPARQRLGETNLMRIGVRNAGQETIPSLVISVSIGGRQGQTSSLPFAIRVPQTGLAEPNRPVWVLAEHYPKLAGSDQPGGAQTANDKVFDFGPLEPGETLNAVWKLTASKTGRYKVLYEIDAGLGGAAEAETPGGAGAGGSLPVRITEVPPDTIVTDDGEVVELDRQKRRTE